MYRLSLLQCNMIKKSFTSYKPLVILYDGWSKNTLLQEFQKKEANLSYPEKLEYLNLIREKTIYLSNLLAKEQEYAKQFDLLVKSYKDEPYLNYAHAKKRERKFITALNTLVQDFEKE